MKRTFEQRRRLMRLQMTAHLFIGHPLGALLSLAGFNRIAAWLHWRTLPLRARKKVSVEQIAYSHHSSLFWLDFLIAPVVHLFAVGGYYYLAHRFVLLWPKQAATALKYGTHIDIFAWGQFSPDRDEVELSRQLATQAQSNRAFWRGVYQARLEAKS